MGFLGNWACKENYLARFRSVFGRFLEICGLLIGGYPGNDSRLYEGEFGVRFFHERCEIFVVVALGAQQDDREVEVCEVLLVREPFVCSEKGVELFLGKAEQLAIFLAGPTLTTDGRCLYLRPEEPCKPPG